MIKKAITTVIVILFVFVLGNFFNKMSSRTAPASRTKESSSCEFRCNTDEPPYRPTHCTSSRCVPNQNNRRGDQPKILYSTFSEAVCAATYDSKKYGNGRAIYRCPNGGNGFHTATQNRGVKFDVGVILDTNGRDISGRICQ